MKMMRVKGARAGARADRKSRCRIRRRCATRLFQDAGREQHVAVAAGTRKLPPRSARRSLHARERGLVTGGVHHREQVVGPVGQMARAAVAVGDEVERTDALAADRVDHRGVDVPRSCHWRCSRWRSGWHHADAANAAVGEHGGEAFAHAALRPRRASRPARRRGVEPAAGRLGGEHEAAVELPQAASSMPAPAASGASARANGCSRTCLMPSGLSLISTKYLAFPWGTDAPPNPVAASMQRAQSMAMPSGVSVASTNHMLSACSRR